MNVLGWGIGRDVTDKENKVVVTAKGCHIAFDEVDNGIYGPSRRRRALRPAMTVARCP